MNLQALEMLSASSSSSSTVRLFESCAPCYKAHSRICLAWWGQTYFQRNTWQVRQCLVSFVVTVRMMWH